MSAVDDIIKQWVNKVEATGELRNHPSWGKPLDIDDGYMQTPTELRMAFKILKDAGYVPAEVEMLKELATLKEQLVEAANEEARVALRARIAELQHKVSMMMERFARKR